MPPINASVSGQPQITASVGETNIDVSVSGGVGPTGSSGPPGTTDYAQLTNTQHASTHAATGSDPITIVASQVSNFTSAVVAAAPPTTDASLLTSGTLSTSRLPGTVVLTTDSRLSDSREWSAATVTQAEAESGSSTDRRAFTPLRVFQAVASWWAGSPAKTKLDGISAGATANATDAQLRDRSTHTGVQDISTVSGLQSALDGKASLVGGLVPSSQLPSYVDDVVEYSSVSAFAATGESGKIYVARDTNKIYRWSGSAYIEISPSPGSTDAVPEGSTNLYYTNARASAAAPVQSVAGKTGAVSLVKADVGLGNVPNVDATNASNIASGVIGAARLPAFTSGKVAYVSQRTGSTDVRTGISPYDALRPFATIMAAASATSDGDAIVIEAGSYDSHSETSSGVFTGGRHFICRQGVFLSFLPGNISGGGKDWSLLGFPAIGSSLNSGAGYDDGITILTNFGTARVELGDCQGSWEGAHFASLSASRVFLNWTGTVGVDGDSSLINITAGEGAIEYNGWFNSHSIGTITKLTGEGWFGTLPVVMRGFFGAHSASGYAKSGNEAGFGLIETGGGDGQIALSVHGRVVSPVFCTGRVHVSANGGYIQEFVHESGNLLIDGVDSVGITSLASAGIVIQQSSIGGVGIASPATAAIITVGPDVQINGIGAGISVIQQKSLADVAVQSYAVNRANHTGTQSISTVSGLQTALDGKAATSHSHSAADITSGRLNNDRLPLAIYCQTVGLQPSGIPENPGDYTMLYVNDGVDSTGSWYADGHIACTGITIGGVSLDTTLAGKAASSHTHGNITSAGAIGSTSGQIVVTTTGGVLTTAATVGISAVSGLQTALDGKAAVSHAHAVADIIDAASLPTTGLTITKTGDWAAQSPSQFFTLAPPQAIQFNNTYTRYSGKWITGWIYSESSYSTTGGSRISALSFDDLQGVTGSFSPSNMAALNTLSLPVLSYVGSSFSPNTMAALTTLSLPVLSYVGSSFSPSNMAALNTLSLPVLSYVGGSFSPFNMAALANVTLPTNGTLKFIGSDVTMTGMALTVASVDNILQALASLDGTNGTTSYGSPRAVNISGGTSAAPSNLGSTTTAGSQFVCAGTTCTVNWTNHGYTTGTVLRISGITTATNANRYAVITVVNANQFTYTITSQNATGAGTATVIRAGASASALVTRGVTLTTN